MNMKLSKSVLLNNGLSKRESEVCAYVIQGFKNKEIALEIQRSIQCIKFHLTNSYKKLGVSNRYEMAIEAHNLSKKQIVSQTLDGTLKVV